jgi:hypothetical protein
MSEGHLGQICCNVMRVWQRSGEDMAMYPDVRRDYVWLRLYV